MNWISFKNKFHHSWHEYVKPFIESKECDNIYLFLKNRKSAEIAPKSNLTFRMFEKDLKNVVCVLILDEPYSNKLNDVQYADGIPLSCEFVNKLHPNLNAFYEGLEKELYGLNLNIIKHPDLNFLINQGVFLISSSLTTEINSPGKHKGLWVPFIKHLIINVFNKLNIPLVFIGEEVFDEYKDVLSKENYFLIVKENISKCNIGIPWNTDNIFNQLNDYLWDKTSHQDIQWVSLEVPF